MHISWFGNTAVKIQAKPFDKDVIVVIDTYKPAKGSFPRSLAPNIGLFSRGQKNSITLSGDPFILDTPGECETNGVLISTVQGHEEDEIMLRVDVEGMSIAHLGMTSKQLTDQQLEVLSDVDILIVPVGGNNCYDPEQAVKAVNSIEPRVVIPVAFKSDNDDKAKPVNNFLKEMGISNGAPEKKVIIKKKDLPQDETKVIVLNKE